jgi:WhiB family redox-sensing transcriptional regulator
VSNSPATYRCAGCSVEHEYHQTVGRVIPKYCRDCWSLYEDHGPRLPRELEPQTFADQALCRESDPDLFVPVGQGASVQEAKAVCRRCPVMEECLAWALRNPDPNAIYGGTTERERRQLRKQQLEAAA